MTTEQRSTDKEVPQFWQCPDCGFRNQLWREWCSDCGKELEGDAMPWNATNRYEPK